MITQCRYKTFRVSTQFTCIASLDGCKTANSKCNYIVADISMIFLTLSSTFFYFFLVFQSEISSQPGNRKSTLQVQYIDAEGGERVY